MALLFVCPFFSAAQKVEIEEASELANIVFKKYNQGKLVNTKEIIPLGSSTKTDIVEADTLLYIVPFEEGGYAIIAGDRGAPPYLGYCPKGNFEKSDLPPGLDYLLEKYKSKISKIKKEKKQVDEDIKKQWEEIYDQAQLKSVTSNVAPMLDTEWGQQRGFNDSIPNNYPAGCTAVAMAQILRYWECRVNPTGSYSWIYNGLFSSANFGATTYWWLDMDDDVGDSYNAQLIYHAGVSCQTKYKSNGSTSTPGRARDGFVNYWGMDNDADVKWRMWHLNNWKDMLVDELHDGRPILYSAGGAEIGDDWVYGHSWVIDGVTVDHNYFWCNWGWYGDYNGWYELGNFKPDDDNYNQMESAIFDVYPVEPGGVATPQLSNQTFTFSSNGYNLTIPDAFGATSYEWITSHGTITGTGTSVTLHTDCSATVQVRAYNEICDIYSSYDAANITINYGPISVSDLICYSSTTASIQNVPNTTITWGGTNVAYPSGNTGTTVIVRAAGSTTSNTGTITASFTIDDTPYTVSETVWVGAPKIDYVSGPTYTPNFQWATYYAQPNNYLMAATDYEWILNPLNGNSVYDYGWTADIAFYNSGYYQVVVRAQNTCGWGSYAVLGVEVYDSKSLAISPNPSNGEITLAIESTDEKEFLTGEEWDFEIYNSSQMLKEKKTKLKGNEYKLNTSNWKDGVYIVRVKYKDEILTGKLIVKR